MKDDRMEKIPLFRRGKWYDSLDLKKITQYLNTYISLAPEVLIMSDYKWVKANIKNFKYFSDILERKTILSKAIHLFCKGEVIINGISQSTDDFKENLWKHCGLTYYITEKWLKMFYEIQIKEIEECQSVSEITDEIYLVSLPANTFLTLEECVALLLKDSILWIKASLREPFSAARFVASLVQAGWPKERIFMYAVERSSLNFLVNIVDKGTLFGGETIKKTFCNNINISIHEPGHSLAIVEHCGDPFLCADQLFERIASNAGRFCKNVSMIACMDDIQKISGKVADCLDLIPIKVDKFSEEDYVITQIWNEEEVLAYENIIRNYIQQGDKILTKRGIVKEIDGVVFPVPILIYLEKPIGHPLIEIELPYPFSVIFQCNKENVFDFGKNSEFIYRIEPPVSS